VRAVALCVCLALAALALAACGDSGPKITTAVPRTPLPVEPTLESFALFAADSIVYHLQQRNPEFFLELANNDTVTCPDETQPRCEGRPEGSSIGGFWLGHWRSEAELLNPDGIRSDITNYLNALGQPELYAIAQGETSILGGPGPAFYAIITDGAAPGQNVRAIEYVIDGGSWRSPLILDAGPLGEEWTSGECADCYTSWRLWETLTATPTPAATP
jgi:hypothetical protein